MNEAVKKKYQLVYRPTLLRKDFLRTFGFGIRRSNFPVNPSLHLHYDKIHFYGNVKLTFGFLWLSRLYLVFQADTLCCLGKTSYLHWYPCIL